ncbi:esterase [Pseudoalteromonas lipolytica SCSIO 04301]|uniref:alpha/beta hydrolase n=1 Tax=Pseudoalteromonas TaxID=53246 RepID=UPI00044DDB55|nr:MULTISPECIES: alpha/beta hydrolase [Pseudoalteromonas]EWH05346.1 esterase [Pseudoalteromonas lipolytica SCSIO 04301]QMW16256.1 alpha/beta hydrolase [Pseudoalteromonas sp. MT33b]
MKHTLPLIAFLLSGISNHVHSASYTLENTYKKLKPRYSELHLPDDSPISNLNVEQHTYPGKLRSQSITIIRPNNNTVLPLIVLVHGGGWGSGSPAILQTLAAKLAAKGFVVATPAYTLSDEAQYPASIHDIALATQWLKSNASRFHLNAEKLTLAGSSAGGQIAALLAYSHGKLLNQSASLAVNARVLINIDGLSDFTTPLALRYENDKNKAVTSASKWLGGRYEEVPAIWQHASPINYISNTSPATLFINGGFARFYAGKKAVQEQLTERGITNKEHVFKEAPHCFWLFHPWQNNTVELISEFINKQLAVDPSR